MEFDLTEPEHLNSAASDSLYFSDLFGDQSEVIAALQDKSSLTGVPMGVLTKADNRHLPKSYDVGGYDENLKRAIAANPGRASYFKDYLPEWEEVTKELVKRQKMTGKLSKEALSRLTDEELAESMKALEAPDVEAAQEEIQKLETQNAVINFMDSMFNDDWRELGDEALKTRLSVVSDATGINIDDIDFKDLRETKGVDMGNLVNLFGARDIVEVSGMLRDWSKYSDLDLSKVDKNSPLDQQLYKLELLRREREMLRDETLREKILNGALGSVPFMLEFAMTGGLAGGLHEGASLGGKQFLRTLINFERNGFLKGYREVLRRGGWAGIGRAIKQGVSEAMKSGARRMPFYIPKITMETMGQVAPRTITLPGENGNPEVNLSEGDITDFFQKFMTNALSQYTELASEEVGALLPNITPQFIRSYVVNGLFKDPMTRKISERLMQTVSFDGLLGEFTEEEIGNFMMYGVTLLENAMQFRRENTAMVDTPLLGKEDTLATLGSIGIQSALLGGMAHVFSNQGALAMLRNATRARALIESADGVVDSIQKLGPIVNNTNQLEWALDQVNGGEKTPVTITVPAAEALFQSIKEETPEIQNDMLEAFEAMGLNMKVIEKHRREGTDIVLYDNRIKAVAAKFKSGHDAMHKIYDNAATMVFGKSAKDFTGDTFPKEQLDKMLEDRVIRDNAMKRWQGIINESLRTAQENAIAAGNPVGLTQSAIRNYESMMPFLANYLGTNAMGEEGIKRVDAMVEGISFEFIKDPEAFDPNAALTKIISGGTVVDEDIENTKKKIADLEERIADYDKFPGMSEQDEERREILRDELFEAQEKLKELEETRKNVLNQVSPVWTGSAASYDQPSLQYVGSGEGAQVYGYGLYGSRSRRVAEWYAREDFKRKSRPNGVKFRGKEVVGPLGLYEAFEHIEEKEDATMHRQALMRIKMYAEQAPEYSLADIIELVKENPVTRWGGESFQEKWEKVVDEVSQDVELVPGSSAGRNLYKQTFWPDKEEDLLDWDEFVPEEQAEKIASALVEPIYDDPKYREELERWIGHDANVRAPFRKLYATVDAVEEDGSQHIFVSRENRDGHHVTVSKDGIILRNSWDDDLDGEPLSALLGKSAARYILAHRTDAENQTLVYAPSRQDYVEFLIPDFAAVTGREMYEELEDLFGTPKAASEFLYKAGIDGVTYIGDSSGMRNYVAFNDADIRVDEHILFQQQNNTVYRGVFLSDFKYSHDSLIGLFNGANASTLPHESAHWLKRCMEDLIGAGLANDKMIEDMNTINAWLDKQDMSIEAAREYGLTKINEKGEEVTDETKMRDEYFARAFEAYLTEGKFPETSNNKLRSALHRLANALKTIYRNALALNAPIDDSIRAFFDGLFAVDQVVEDTSTLEAILRVVDAGAIAMPKDALKDLEKDVELAREDAETEANLAALRAYCKGLSEQKKGWRDEAKAAYMASKAEQAFAYVRRGHRISEDFLRNVLKLDEETIAILKGKRLTVKGTPAKVKSEAPAESPVQEETATEAEAPSEEPEATNVPPVTLEGINESNIADTWKSIDKNAPVIIPDADTLYYVLDMLIKNDDFHDERLSNAYAQLTKVGKQSGQEYYKVNKDGNVRTKKNFEALVKFVMHNQTVEDFDRMKKTDSLDQEDQSGRTGYETTADTRAATPLKDTTQEILDAFEKVVNEMPEGEDKKIARIIFEHSRSEYRIVKKDIYEEYKENGGTLGKSAVYGRIKRIQDEIRNRLSEQDYDLIDFYSFQTGTAEELPADILETMRETGYEDIMSLLDDLRTAVGERQFIKNFMLDKEAQYRDSFLQNPVWNSETGALRYMDALLRALKLTEGMKYNERKKLAIQKAKDEIEALKVRDIVSEERNARMSLKSNAEAIMKALKDKKHDKEAAITAAVFMHANAVRLEAIRKVREKLDNTRNYVRRLSRLKPGSTVEGDAVTAIVDVLFHLKLTARRPAWSGESGAPGTVTGVFREIVERSIGEMGLTPDMLGKDGYPNAGQIVEAEMGQWSEWLMNQISGGEGFVGDYRDLTFDQFEEVRDFVEWLRDRGHDTVANDKATFAAKRRETMDGILASLDENATGKYTRHADKTATEKLRAMTRTGQHQLKTLVFMSHFLDGNTEFYGEHKIGAFRKLQLKVSEGVARQQFWYQKISSAVKPHVLALMKSAKDRKLRFEVKNEITKDVYDDIHGETAAFVLLNAGQVDGRQRLMSGFGWTEEELDDNLRQFTEEDFKHAEAIWAELNTLGRELAKVFYQQRHYRMKWAKLAPINLILNDGKGTHIMSEGGYYPIAYSYREGEEVRNDDIMNPFRAPARLARPSATYGREARVENAALLLSPTVIERSIMENARYIGLWEPLRMMNSIWTDGAVKRSIIRNFSEEAYDTLRDLMNQVNDPDRGEKGKWKKIVSYLGSAMAVAALGFKATTMAKQYASLSIGAERLKAVDPKTGQMRNFFMESFQKGLTNLKKLRDTVSNESPFLRDRYNFIDKDLKVINSEFKSKFGKAVDWYRRWAFFGLKWNDLNVAVVQWDAAYNWALFTQKDMTESEARAFADDFVASTQGGARDVDIPEVQLSTFGRLITPFFGPSAAAANTRIAGLSTMRDMTPAERIIFVVDNLLIPGLEQAVVMAVSAGAIGWAASGGDDEDAWDRVQQKFLISMLTEPLSGIPLIQDISDAAIRSAVTGKPVQSGVFDVSLFRPLEESARDMNQIIRNMKKMEDFGYSLYLGASIAGVLTRMPIIQVYEDYERMLINNNFWFSDERAEKQLKGEKRK